jgi:hypothetical protein
VTVEELINRLDDAVTALQRQAAATEHAVVLLEQVAISIEHTTGELLQLLGGGADAAD